MQTESSLPLEIKDLSKSYLGLGFGILALGFSAIFVRVADAPGTVTAFYRMAIGSAVIFVPFVRQRRQSHAVISKRGFWLAVLGGLFFGLDLTFWTTGIDLGGASIPTLMANTAPLWVGLGAWLIFRERQTNNFWVGLFLAMTGSVVILGQDFFQLTSLGVGGLFGLLAAVFYGGYYLVTQQARSNVPTLDYFWIATTSSALLLLLVNLILGRPFFGYDRFTFLNFIAIGVIVQVVGWVVITYVQGHLPASIVSATLLAQPVLTAIIAWLLLGEEFSRWQVLGGITVITGVYIVHRSRNASHQVIEPEELIG